MITGIINQGSGIGDQLFSYVATRTHAEDMGFDFSFVGKEYFKGKDFLNLDWGVDNNYNYHTEEPSGKLMIDGNVAIYELNTPFFNPEFDFIPDGAFIDGYGAQDIKYFEHKLDDMRQWFKVEPLLMGSDKCVINFRGGEFQGVPELFLPRDYWDKAIGLMKERNPKMRFEVHTDDPKLALQFFPEFPIVSGIDLNWRNVRYARNLILANSAFGIIPALIGSADEVIAPKYWARRNVGRWEWPMNYYRRFTYI